MTLSILNSRTKINLSDPSKAEYFDEKQIAYLIERDSGKYIVVTSFGHLSLQPGDRVELKEDQSQRITDRMARVAGLAQFHGGLNFGATSSKNLPHYVCK